MEEIILEDKQAMIFLNNLGSSTFDPFWILVSEKWFWIPLYVIFLYFLYKNFNKKSLFYILLFVALGITASDQIANIFKFGFERLRPCHDPSLEGLLREVKCGGKFGFYSAHSSNSFFVATYLTILLGKKIKQLPYFLYVWAAVVAYSRVYLGMHFPGDIIVGAIMGILLALFFGTLAKKVIRKSEVFTQDS
ncbi:phosphatase PAP2 family protein [Cloacibacterium sp. TD35]|uniref:phosphatase PAP2 family protein n=1 Tax=Cloacibacterium sp. TD35 TaxID=2976818 RepID=UPI00237DED69|nr:phosphatase PAP2 family protein [Cloacibacterium sp. TD35]WDT67348.1 phosphatase PAP2 family protein [Cloacibacterium sp. TD35]